MISRRNFICGAAAAALPLTPALDPYGAEFFRIVRSRFINLPQQRLHIGAGNVSDCAARLGETDDVWRILPPTKAA